MYDFENACENVIDSLTSNSHNTKINDSFNTPKSIPSSPLSGKELLGLGLVAGIAALIGWFAP